MKKKIVVAVTLGIIFILIILFLRRGEIVSNIHIVDNFNVLEQKLPALDTNSLVIFDIDLVLLIEADPWERGYRDKRKKMRTVTSLFAENSSLSHELDPQMRDYLWSIYVRQHEQMLLDDQVVNIIKKLQDNRIKVIALTRFLAGSVDSIPAIEDVRINWLKSRGIDLRSSFAPYNYIVFKQFAFENRSPIFKDGILFTSFACSKQELLPAFFQAIQWYPDRVIMFDDKINNHVSVGQALARLHIPYEGFQYIKAAQLPAYFDKKIAEFQMQYLMKHKQWISTAQARKMIGDQQ